MQIIKHINKVSSVNLFVETIFQLKNGFELLMGRYAMAQIKFECCS